MNSTMDFDFFSVTSLSINLTFGNSILKYEVITPDEFIFINEIMTIITFLISFPGACVNALNIRTFILMGLDDGITVSFLALSISDFCYTFVSSVQSVAGICSSIESKYGLWFGVDPYAVLFHCANLGVLLYINTVLITAFLALGRCLCVARPFQFKNMFTKFRSVVILSTFPVIAFVSQGVLFGHTGFISKFDAKVNTTRVILWLSDNRDGINDVARFIAHFVLPVITEVIVVVCVIIMAIKLQQSVRFRRKQDVGTKGNEPESTRLSGKERMVVVQVVVISTIFIVCTIPKIFTSVFGFIEPKFAMGQPYHYLYLTVHSSRTLFDCINSSVNFFVYVTFNSRFRSRCSSLWKRTKPSGPETTRELDEKLSG